MRWFRKNPVAPNAAAGTAVQGERGAPLVVRRPNLQARVSNWLAMGLTVGIGTLFLVWYYAHAARGPARVRSRAQAASESRASSDVSPPPLGAIEAPAPAGAAVEPTAALAQSAPPPAELSASLATAGTVPAAPGANSTQTQNSPLQRRLSGTAFQSAPAAISALTGASPVPQAGNPYAPPSVATEAAKADLSSLLQPDVSASARARVLADRSLLLPQGAFIDCTLETAIDSTLPGMTTCVTATDTFSADGTVVLLERGTKLVGETRGQVQQGAARVFVLWTLARTPTGVVVPLDSPGADELGRSGLAGEVERHFWQRFGAAILISTIDAGTQLAVQDANRGGGAVIYDPSSTQGVTTEALKSTVNIAPTVVKHNGDRIQVLVVRDIDFSQVYELRDVSTTP